MTDKKSDDIIWTVHDYQYGTAGSLVRAFISGLSQEATVEAAALLKLLRERGNRLRMPHSRALGNGLFELRELAHGIRIFYMFRPQHQIILLDGIVKKTQTTPSEVLRRVRGFQAEVNKKAENPDKRKPR